MLNLGARTLDNDAIVLDIWYSTLYINYKA